MRARSGFCGAIDYYHIVALSASDARTPSSSELNVFSYRFPQFFEPTAGDILLLGSDERGEACSVHEHEIRQLLR